MNGKKMEDLTVNDLADALSNELDADVIHYNVLSTLNRH